MVIYGAYLRSWPTLFRIHFKPFFYPAEAPRLRVNVLRLSTQSQRAEARRLRVNVLRLLNSESTCDLLSPPT